MQREIKHRFAFSQPVEIVWEHLTDSELLAQWLMPNDFKPVVGHKFQFGAKPKYPLGFDGRIYCEVLEIVPYKKLVYSWKGGLSKENPSLVSTVTWILTPVDHGTVLELEHEGFKGVKNYLAFIIMDKGWAKIGKRMSKQLNLSSHDII
ncbi:SRPBCC domain-containing protein [Flagellimonas alvinocaridis]|uniref:SRPBCC domain-containing protein n=1 Tax=Flagellimonas alvinocaridis TaxID=2530200 RepID=A0A4S8RID8_9FLAO|nr:SRPBCC domain-containing protein [Allomuricauda alvinocaridis]THV58163.1 SRPBCC domain-containing protein [Allomuricauda alvinocaridis]